MALYWWTLQFFRCHGRINILRGALLLLWNRLAGKIVKKLSFRFIRQGLCVAYRNRNVERVGGYIIRCCIFLGIAGSVLRFPSFTPVKRKQDTEVNGTWRKIALILDSRKGFVFASLSLGFYSLNYEYKILRTEKKSIYITEKFNR